MFEEMSQGIQEEDLQEAFSIFDVDNDGFITAQEIKLLFLKLGQAVNHDDVIEIMRDCDTNKDGLIDFQGIF